MSRIKIRLVGCDRYNFGGELYEKGKVYNVGESKGTILLRKEDEFERPYFVPYIKAEKTDRQRLAEKAAALAIAAAAEAAAEEEAIVVVDDDEEEVIEFDPDAAVEVDQDDDPELDEEDPENPEEVDEDRDDGTAVEV